MTSWLIRTAVVGVVLYVLWMMWKSWSEAAAKSPAKSASKEGGGLGGKKDMLDPDAVLPPDFGTTTTSTVTKPKTNPKSAGPAPKGPCPKPGQKWKILTGPGGKGYWDCR